MKGRVAIVTGSSSGIGRAVAAELLARGMSVVVTSRSQERADATAAELGGNAFGVAAELIDPAAPAALVDRALARFGRLDVLVNNAGVGIGAAVAEQQSKFVDMQIAVNLRAIILFYRECAEMLRAAGAEHGKALVVNLSSFAGKSGQPWLSVYSATKAGVVGYTQAMNKELNSRGVKSVALCPGFVETPMTEFIREQVKAEDMIRVEDIAEAVRFVLRTSPNCVIPEIVFQRPGEDL
jgi:NAD(P)-dependent dehydrogenase (short-subunit alcohol dehydrogenase family)